MPEKRHRGLPPDVGLEDENAKKLGRNEGVTSDDIYVSVFKVFGKEYSIQHVRGELASYGSQEIYPLLLRCGMPEIVAVGATVASWLCFMKKELDSMPLAQYNEKYGIK